LIIEVNEFLHGGRTPIEGPLLEPPFGRCGASEGGQPPWPEQIHPDARTSPSQSLQVVPDEAFA
jgi:hypothetical protein